MKITIDDKVQKQLNAFYFDSMDNTIRLFGKKETEYFTNLGRTEVLGNKGGITKILGSGFLQIKSNASYKLSEFSIEWQS